MDTPERRHVRIRVRVRPGADPDLVSAEAWEAGVAGVEEREETGSTVLILYAAASAAGALRAALAPLPAVAELSEPELLEPIDWREQWKHGIDAVAISARLRIRPSFVTTPLPPGGCEVVIDPGLAFGTGHHASTRLALEWVDACCHGATPARVLDVGTGSGVLALAALQLGAAEAVAFDLDRLAAPEALRWARVNGLERGLHLFTGSLEALAAEEFDLVVANLIRTELLPLAGGLARRLAPEGRLVLSGLLATDLPEVEAQLAALGLLRTALRESLDVAGDHWVSPLMRWRPPARRASPR